MGVLTSQGEVKRWSLLQNYSTTQENQLNPATPFRSIQILPGMFMSTCSHLVLRSQCSLLSDIPEKLQCKEDFNSLFTALSTSTVCIGNPDKRFDPLKMERKVCIQERKWRQSSCLRGYQSLCCRWFPVLQRDNPPQFLWVSSYKVQVYKMCIIPWFLTIHDQSPHKSKVCRHQRRVRDTTYPAKKWKQPTRK